MNLSFSTRGWPDLSWDEMLSTAKDMGFSGVEVYNLAKFDPLLQKGGPFHKYNSAATIRKLADDGISVPCVDISKDISMENTAENAGQNSKPILPRIRLTVIMFAICFFICSPAISSLYLCNYITTILYLRTIGHNMALQ